MSYTTERRTVLVEREQQVMICHCEGPGCEVQTDCKGRDDAPPEGWYEVWRSRGMAEYDTQGQHFCSRACLAAWSVHQEQGESKAEAKELSA